MEGVHRIIRRSPAGHGSEPNQAGVTDASNVHPKLVVVVFAPQFSGRFGYAVDRGGQERCVLRRAILGGIGPKHCNGTRPKHAFHPPFSREFEGVKQGVHVQTPCGHGVDLTFRRKHGHQVVHDFHVMAFQNGALGVQVCGVGCDEHAFGRFGMRRGPDVREKHSIDPVALLQAEHELDAQLPGGADNEMLAHGLTKVG